jgi:putative hydrolase of the HAD superfamily
MDPLLILLDLDNTLVDRDDAFARWAEQFVAEHGGGADVLDWLLSVDGHGYTHRAVLADGLLERLELTTSRDELVRTLLHGYAPFVRCYDGVPERLRALRADGHILVLLTNGAVVQQTRKLAVTGLDALLHRTVISEAVGTKKPAAEIFAAATAGAPSGRPGWMVGDHVEADMAGGRAAGLRTGWVSHGRTWPDADPPTLSAPTTAEVLDLIAARAEAPDD